MTARFYETQQAAGTNDVSVPIVRGQASRHARLGLRASPEPTRAVPEDPRAAPTRMRPRKSES